MTVFQDERARIEALGGCVTYMDCWRVNGTLAVSRAIGKHQHSSDQTLLKDCITVSNVLLSIVQIVNHFAIRLDYVYVTFK